jgi:hypothetical protein
MRLGFPIDVIYNRPRYSVPLFGGVESELLMVSMRSRLTGIGVGGS